VNGCCVTELAVCLKMVKLTLCLFSMIKNEVVDGGNDNHDHLQNLFLVQNGPLLNI
jgi:hypothetical protein